MKKVVMIPFIIIVCMLLIVNAVVAGDWVKPVYAYGDGLSDEEMEKLAGDLGYKLNDLELLILHVEDMRKYIDQHEIGEMYSSAILVKQKRGFGVEVKINTPELITEVTEGEYENAMITAGVVDMLVLVDSPIEATGHSALTGIYKAYDTQGEILDEERMKVAQDELEITSSIVQEHQYNEGFNTDNFNNSMRGVKLHLGKEKKADVTEEVVDKIVTDAIREEDLDEVLTEYNIQDILELFMRYSQTSAMDDENVKEQLEKGLNGDIDVGFFTKIMNFISGLFGSIFGSKTVEEEVSGEVEPDTDSEMKEDTLEPEEEMEEEERAETVVKDEPVIEEEVEEVSTIHDEFNSCQDDYSEVLKDLPPNFFIPDCTKITALNRDSNELTVNFEVEGDWLEILQGYTAYFNEAIVEEMQDRKTEYGELTAFYYPEEAAYTKVVIAQDDATVSIDVFQVFP